MIILLMRDVSDGLTFMDPLEAIEVRRIMDAFVDDTTIYINNFYDDQQNPAKLIQQLQAAAQWWEELLSATGRQTRTTQMLFLRHSLEI